MSEDFYHKNIFGEVVDLDLGELTSPQFLSSDEERGNTKNGFNIFALTDAVGARDKKNAWILYQKALASRMVAEEIFYRIFWIVKSMILASRTKSFEETEMKEFPYKKAKQYANNFSKEELENLSETLVVGYHKARRGIGEVDSVIEKMLLRL